MTNWPPLELEQRKNINTKFAQQRTKRLMRMFDVLVKQKFHSLLRPNFKELPPRDRRAVYVQYPPVLEDGSIPGMMPVPEMVMDEMGMSAPTGRLINPVPYNWLWMSVDDPYHYGEIREDYGRLMMQQIDKLEDEYEEMLEEYADAS